MSRRQRDIVQRSARLTAAQVRAVAALRLDDAAYLHASDLARHATGVVYLCGLVIDCLLKARLLEKHPWLRTARPEELDPASRRTWQLIYRLHDLEAMLQKLPEVERRLVQVDPRGSFRLVAALKAVCAGWTIQARYNTKPVGATSVAIMLADVKELRKWLA
jgi:hypothetical protein